MNLLENSPELNPKQRLNFEYIIYLKHKNSVEIGCNEQEKKFYLSYGRQLAKAIDEVFFSAFYFDENIKMVDKLTAAMSRLTIGCVGDNDCEIDKLTTAMSRLTIGCVGDNDCEIDKLTTAMSRLTIGCVGDNDCERKRNNMWQR